MKKRKSYLRLAIVVMGLYLLVLGLFVAQAQEDVAPIETAYVAWSPDGNYLAIGGLSEVNIVDATTEQVINSFPVSRIRTAPVSWSANGQQIGFSIGDGNFQIWSNPTTVPKLEMTIDDYVGSKAIDWHPDNQIIALSDLESTNFWDITNQISIKRVSTEYTAFGVWSLDWNQQGNMVLIGDGRFVGLYNYETATFETTFGIEPFLNRYQEYINPVAFSVAWSPSEAQIAVGSDDAVRVLNLSDYVNEPYVMLGYDSYFYGHEGDVYSVSWHPGEQYLASGGEDGTIRIWDVTTGEQVHIIEFPENTFVRSVAWSPDGSQLAYGSPDGELEVILVPSTDILPVTTNEN
jgi:WD40 repeat protein